MQIAVLSFTERGGKLNTALCAGLSGRGYEVSDFEKRQAADRETGDGKGPVPIEEGLSSWTGKAFAAYDALVFVGACGIAVRAIAPYVKDKFKDPAVLAIDEGGGFVVSLLSGHAGGANELAGIIAELTGAVPVSSTATDVNGKFAVDVFARKNRLFLIGRKQAKLFSAALLSGKTLPFYSTEPIDGEVPEGIRLYRDSEEFLRCPGIKAAVSERRLSEDPDILYLVPRTVALGTGCKFHIPEAVFEQRIEEILSEAGIFREAVGYLASIDLKKEEPALLYLADKWNLPFETYSREELAAVPEKFSESEFVKRTVGVGCVCERAAVLAAKGQSAPGEPASASLILKKQAGGGVTAAAAKQNHILYWEKENQH